MMSPFRRLQHSYTILTHDVLVIPLAWFGAFWLRFNLESIPEEFWTQAVQSLWVLMPVQGLSFWYFGLYRGVWRFASVPDLVRIAKAGLVGTLVVLLTLFLLTRLQDIPRSVFPLYFGLLVFFLGAPRFLYRWLKDYRIHFHNGTRVLVIGAGRAGEILARELLTDRQHRYEPIAFLDDNRVRHGKEIHGLRVLGDSSKVFEVCEEQLIELIILAVPSARARQLRRLVELCERTELPFRMVPKTEDLLSGQVTVNELREVRIEDLLGRKPAELDWQGITAGLTGKRILVTGAGGSIGSELCRQLARLNPDQLLLLDNGEFNLYSIDMELQEKFPELAIRICLADVTDAISVDTVMSEFKPDAVFHAAAYKHVPLLEDKLRNALKNNVLGTRTVAEAAVRNGADRFVLISTDKAVNPTNIMGMSKRMAEIFCQNRNLNSDTRFITVRFGNVLGSAGSVVPLFRRQVQEGGPITVTHPDIERYFMTIPEACQLIMQASVMGRGGEIYVLDMGDPVKITYLAEQMIRLAGKIPGEDIEIEFTGLRPGEKMYEELFHDDEPLVETDHQMILQAQFRQVDEGRLHLLMEQIKRGCEGNDQDVLFDVVAELVPEYENKAASIKPKMDEAGGSETATSAS